MVRIAARYYERRRAWAICAHLMGMRRYILLDIDGTLVDSNRLHAASWHDALAQYGIESDVDALQRLIGIGADKLLPQATGIPIESELGTRIKETRSKLFMRDYLPRAQPPPGSRALVERICSSRSSWTRSCPSCKSAGCSAASTRARRCATDWASTSPSTATPKRATKQHSSQRACSA